MTRRFAPALLAIVLLAAACGGSGGDAEPAAVPAPATDPGAAAVTAPSPGAGAFDGPPVPDFTLALENREATYRLSASDRPLYLVFWAEW